MKCALALTAFLAAGMRGSAIASVAIAGSISIADANFLYRTLRVAENAGGIPLPFKGRAG